MNECNEINWITQELPIRSVFSNFSDVNYSLYCSADAQNGKVKMLKRKKKKEWVELKWITYSSVIKVLIIQSIPLLTNYFRHCSADTPNMSVEDLEMFGAKKAYLTFLPYFFYFKMF